MSIVTRGLGRRGTAATMLVTAGLGLALALTPVATAAVGGSGGRWHADDRLALEVARGERDSGGWWGYVKPAGHGSIAGPHELPLPGAPVADLDDARPGARPEEVLLMVTMTAELNARPLGPEELVLLQALALADRRAQVHHAPAARLGVAGDEATLITAILMAEQVRLETKS